MAYSLTVAGYTFQNPPEEYRKLARLSNSPQTAIGKEATAFFQSDSQDLQFQVDGTLALDPPLGEPSDDLDELEELQDLAIEGGEVAVEFDPFFSGNAVIEDDPFRQKEGESTYSFTFSVNSEDTDSTAYPSHSTPETGNTFQYGDLDLGYDPNTVQQNYERQTEKVKRLQGIARTVDNDGLIPKIQISGLIDGGGQAELWDKARSNVLAYLSAEFQNGWALLDSLSIRNAPEAPDYLTGLFRYDADLLIVMDPASGIGETTKFVDQEVKESTQYVSDCTEDGLFERLGENSETYPEALDFHITGGTGKLNGDYLEWQEDYGTLAQSATNHIWIEDPDGDGYGQVNTGTSGFPGNTVPLWEVDTGTSSVDAIRDQRTCLTGSREPDTGFGDLNFSDSLSVDDRMSIENILALPPDQMTVSDPINFWRGSSTFTDTLSASDSDLLWQIIQGFSDSLVLDDGGSASSGGGTVTTGTVTWETASDWDSAVSAQSVNHPSGVVSLLPGSDDFDDQANNSGLPAPWNTPGDATIDTAIALGTASVDTSGNTSTEAFAASSFGSITSDDLFYRMRYHEGSGQSGSAWGLQDANGNIIVEMASGNPQRGFYSGNGVTRDFDTWGYGQWYGWEIDNFDFTNYTFDIHALDSNGDRAYSFPNEPFVNNVPVEKVWYGGQKSNADYGWSTGVATAQQWDNTFGVFGSGSITTATKTFSSAVTPDLDGLNYALNGQNITVDVIGSPGTASEETITQVLDGSSSYSLSWNSSHTDFRIRATLESTDRQSGPTVNSLGLKGASSSGGDPDQNPKTQWEILGAKHDTSGNEYEGGGVKSRYGG